MAFFFFYALFYSPKECTFYFFITEVHLKCSNKKLRLYAVANILGIDSPLKLKLLFM